MEDFTLVMQKIVVFVKRRVALGSLFVFSSFPFGKMTD